MVFLFLLKIILYNAATGTVKAAPIKFSSRPTSDFASPSYVPNPRVRGTIYLFLTSIITLMLCVYTSTHLNIAANSDMFSITMPRYRLFSKRQKYEDTAENNSGNMREPYRIQVKRATVYRFYWVVIVLFAPKYILFAAPRQWKKARALRKRLRNIVANGKDGMKGDDATEPEDQEEGEFLKFLKPTLISSVETKDWSSVSMTPTFFVKMGGYAYRRGYDFKIPASNLKFPYVTLTA